MGLSLVDTEQDDLEATQGDAAQQAADLLDKEIQEAEDSGISQDRFRPTAADVADTIVDFTPIIGDIKGGVEGAEVIFDELKKDDPSFLFIGIVGGASVLGLIPGVGDAAQKLIMKGAKKFKKDKLAPEVMEELSVAEQKVVEDLTKNTEYTPTTEGELYADRIATMLREGRGSDITDDMLEEAGKYDDFHKSLTQEYINGNVGMDLPMDWESTMARGADQGLTETRYHGSVTKDIPYFKGRLDKVHKSLYSEPGQSTGMFNTPDPFKAFSYEGKNGETYSLLMRPLPEDTPRVDVEGANWSNLDEPSINYNKNQLSPDVRQGSRMNRQAQPLDEFIKTNQANLTSDMFMKQADTLGYPGATIENVVDRGPSTPIRFSREEGIKARALAREPSETQARTDTTGIRSIGARFDPRLTGLKNINMAQGGLTDMNEQTQMAFALGGEAETVDPISGNDVPPGSLPVEVRDDIDAKLSEGEYVVPADVVRFFGVKFFEDLRMEAKMGLQQMDTDGRIGGEPIPSEPQMNEMAEMSDQDIDSLIDAEMNNMNQGGMVGQQNPTNSLYSDPNKTDQVISKLGAAASKDPEFSRMLSERGISVPNTNATQTPEQMQDANRPDMSQKPKMGANKGGLMGYAPGGAVEGFDSSTIPKSSFSPADFDSSTYFDDLMSSGGSTITRIEVIGPGGGKQFMYWGSNVPLPEGYKLVSSKKASKKSKGKDRSKSFIDKNPPPKPINLNKLSMVNLQKIQQDYKRKRKSLLGFGMLGAFVDQRSKKDFAEAIASKEALINAIPAGDLRKERLKEQLNNLKTGKDVITGSALKELPGITESGFFADIRTLANKGKMSEADRLAKANEDEITAIYTDPSHKGALKEGADGNLYADLDIDKEGNKLPEKEPAQSEYGRAIRRDASAVAYTDYKKGLMSEDAYADEYGMDDPTFNPQNMSTEAYKDARKKDMDPRKAPDFGGNWTTVRNEGSNTWGRKWTGAEDKLAGKETFKGFKKKEDETDDLPAGQSASGNEPSGLGGMKKGGYVTSKKTKQRTNGLASRA
jgi:hypothetical protein